jgi:hypothetical protein
MRVVAFLGFLAGLAMPAMAVSPSAVARVEQDLRKLRADLAETGGAADTAAAAGGAMLATASSSGGCASTDAAIFASPPTDVASAEKMIRCGRDYYVGRRDRRGVFLTAYSAVTVAIIRDRDAGLYTDRAWLNKLLVKFVEYYRRAAKPYIGGGGSGTPRCWKLSYDYARNANRPVILDLLAAMTAHIVHDLGASVNEVGFDPIANAGDFFRVEQSLSAGTDAIIGNLKEFYQTNALSTADGQLGNLDEVASAFAMRIARIGAYGYAISLKRAQELTGARGVTALKSTADVTAATITYALERLIPTSVKQYMIAIEREHDPIGTIGRDIRIVIDNTKLARSVRNAQRTWRDTLAEVSASVQETAAEVRENLNSAGQAISDTATSAADSATQTVACSCRSTALGTYDPPYLGSNCQLYGESRKWCYVRGGSSCRSASPSSTYRSQGVYYRYC